MSGNSANVRRPRGFTLIELLVVMTIIGVLLTIAVPRYFRTVQRSKETVLRRDLSMVRESIDRYYGDLGQYPDALASPGRQALHPQRARSILSPNLLKPGSSSRRTIPTIPGCATFTAVRRTVASDGSPFVSW